MNLHAPPARRSEAAGPASAERSGGEVAGRSPEQTAGNLATATPARELALPLTAIPAGLGNLAVQRLCSACAANGAARGAAASGVRVLGAPGDPWEREADRVADAVTMAPATAATRPPLSHRPCPACAAERSSDALPVQRQTAAAGPGVRAASGPGTTGGPALSAAAATRAAAAPGTPLAASVRGRIEPVVGADLSAVRVHADAESGQAAAALGARAFTRGSDIFIGPGQDPGDPRLLAHEAAHVVQQRGMQQRGVREPPIQRDGGGAAETHTDEREDQFAERVKAAAVVRLNQNIVVLGEWSTYVEAMAVFQLQSQLLAGHVRELAETAAPTPGGRQRFERYAGTEQAGERAMEGAQLDPQATYGQRVGGFMSFLGERTQGSWTTPSVAQRLGGRAGIGPGEAGFESRWVGPDPRYAEYAGAIERWQSGESGGCQTCHDINHAWGRTADLWGDPLPRGEPFGGLATSGSLFGRGLPGGLSEAERAALADYAASLSGSPASRITGGSSTAAVAARARAPAPAATRGGPFRPDLELPKGVTLPPPRTGLCGPLPPAEDEGSAGDRFDPSLWGPSANLALNAVAEIGAVLRPLGPRGYRVLERSTFDSLWAAGPDDLAAQRTRIVAAIAAKQDAYRELIGSIQGGSVGYETLCPIVDELLPSTNPLLRFHIEWQIRERRAIETLIGWFDLALTALNVIFPPSVLATLPLRAASGLVKLALGAEQLREAPTLERAQGSGVISAHQETQAEGIRTSAWINIITGGIDVIGAGLVARAVRPSAASGFDDVLDTDLRAGVLRSDWESEGLFGLQREPYLPRLKNESIEAWQQRMIDDINERLVAPHLDPAFEARGEVFEGAWFDRPRGITEFSEEELTIYFGRTQALNKQTVGEELQHTHDYLLGARRNAVGQQVRTALLDDVRINGPHGRMTPEGELTDAGVEWANKWWHRRVYTRLMQNAHAERHGLGYLRPHLEEIHAFYRARLDGPLSLEEILQRTWEGLY